MEQHVLPGKAGRRFTGSMVFVFSLVFVFLILAAQYESWSLPFSILLGTPFAIFGAFLALYVARMYSESFELNVFAQIALVMLIAMAAKNAILIVEFAKLEFDKGFPFDAAVKSAKLRFRPILMTAFSFILGVMPLVVATGAGAEARVVMGMALLGGMTLATLLGVFFYPMLLLFSQRLALSRFTLGSRQESLAIIQKRFDRGIIPEIDVNQAQIQREIAVAAIPLYRRGIAKTEHVLSILLGQYPQAIKTGQELHLQPIPPAIPAGLPSTILERRPDVSVALAQLHSQTAKIGVAEAMRFPAISLTGLLGVGSFELNAVTDSGEIWSAGAGLVGPIFNWNKNIRRVDIEEERTRQALLNYEKVVLQAYREVADALVEIDTLQEQLMAVTRKNDAAKNANMLSKLRYDKGATSYLEVLDTERTLFSVGLEQSELQQQYRNAYVKLYKALGGGWLSEEEMTESSAAED
jgi:hypothetical protein